MKNIEKWWFSSSLCKRLPEGTMYWNRYSLNINNDAYYLLLCYYMLLFLCKVDWIILDICAPTRMRLMRCFWPSSNQARGAASMHRLRESQFLSISSVPKKHQKTGFAGHQRTISLDFWFNSPEIPPIPTSKTTQPTTGKRWSDPFLRGPRWWRWYKKSSGNGISMGRLPK